MKLNIIVAYEHKTRGIGFENDIPWYFPNDLKHFSKLTKGNGNNAIIMGRKTWESLPKKPLPKRQNIILSRTYGDNKQIDNELYFNDITTAIEYCKSEKNKYEELWIIGGNEIYKQTLERFNNQINNIFVTEIEKEYKCDTFFPEISSNFICVNETVTVFDNITIRYKKYENSILD